MIANLKSDGIQKLKLFINFIIYLPIFINIFSCALGQQQALIAEQYEQQRRSKQKEVQSTYYVKIVCPEEAEKYIGTKYLEFPYSVPLRAGETVDFVLYYPETGIKYGGQLYGMEEDREGFGKYPGYELCISDALLREADTGGNVIFYLRSPRGVTMVKVTIWRNR